MFPSNFLKCLTKLISYVLLKYVILHIIMYEEDYEEEISKASFANEMMDEFEELLSYSDDCHTLLSVTLPKETVIDELRSLRDLPFSCYSIGNHRIYLTKEKKPPEVKNMQYTGCFWLLKNRMQPGLECRMNIESVCKFTCFTRALMLIVLEEVSSHKHYNELVERWNFKQTTSLQVEKLQTNSSEATSFKKVIVHTDYFGKLRAPTMQEMDSFLQWAKITNFPL